MDLKRALMVGLVWLGMASTAHAGWVIEETMFATKSKGDALPAEPATTRLSQGRLRVTQPNSVTVQDCVKERFSILVPERNTYWSGSFDEYTTELLASQAAARNQARQKPAATPRAKKPPEIDPAKLPKIVVRKTEETQKIAGYDATKYVIDSDGRKFQEVWLAGTLSLKDDLDPAKFIACQSKLTRGMQGQSAKDYGALYRSADYAQMMAAGYPLKVTVYHIAGSFTREVRSITRADVSDHDFTLPQAATRVALAELFGAPDQR
jgi:hypothetical protein